MFYINMGYETEGPGTNPLNMSHVMLPAFGIVGPSRDPYPGTFCLPQVPLPADRPDFKIGDNATIQVVETAVHGAALYNVSDHVLEGRDRSTSPPTDTSSSVHRHHLCRTGRRRTGQQVQLLQLLANLPQPGVRNKRLVECDALAPVPVFKHVDWLVADTRCRGDDRSVVISDGALATLRSATEIKEEDNMTQSIVYGVLS